MDIKLPRWLVRKIVRRNPWLLSDEGRVRRAIVLELFGLAVELYGDFGLTPEEKAFFLTEAEMQRGGSASRTNRDCLSLETTF